MPRSAEQARLADARIAGQQQGSAGQVPGHPVEQIPDRLLLGITPMQKRHIQRA